MNALVFAGDDAAGIGLAVAIHSAVKHFGADAAVVVMDAGMSRETRARLTRVHPAVQLVDMAPERLAGLSAHRRPLGAYAWLLMPELLPEMRRAIYLDYDVLVKRDLAPLLAIEFNDAPVAGVRDFHRPNLNGRPHFNSGVLVLDCERWRADELGRHVLQYAVEQGEQMTLQDQEALNMVVQRWVELDPSWNVQRSLTWIEGWAPSELTDRLLPERHRLWRDAGVIHFSGFPKPWYSSGAKPWYASGDMPCMWTWAWSLLASRYYTPAERARWMGVWLAKRATKRMLSLMRWNARAAASVRRRLRNVLGKVQRNSEDQL